LSRYKLDAVLASEFLKLGGELKVESRWKSEAGMTPVVHACGRRVQSERSGQHWFGVKAHATNVPLAADLEMHVCRYGYIGANRIDEGEVNVCGLLKARPGDAGKSKITWLRGDEGTPLHDHLREASFREDSFCAVGGISLRPRAAREQRHCCIGDAITMIPPVTGNGMSMAFESAQMAIVPLAEYSRGRSSWDQARLEVARRCDAAFARRLAWARLLQWLMISNTLGGPLGTWLLNSAWFWSFMFARTR
jgi:2-polyprenyl-6-methoxyphenol hydroxylase-like FAD-dependent oxidoreductase